MSIMTQNVGANDAHARIIAAGVLVLIALFLVENAYVRIVLALVAAALAATAFFRTCFIYRLSGMDTCRPGSGTKEPDASAETPSAGSADESELNTEHEKASESEEPLKRSV